MNYKGVCTYQGFNLCNADPAAFAYDDADNLVASVSSVANLWKKTCRPRNVEDDKDAEDAVLSNFLKNFDEKFKRKTIATHQSKLGRCFLWPEKKRRLSRKNF